MTTITELESDVIQTAITAYCKREDTEAQEAHDQAVSALIEARYQSIKNLNPNDTVATDSEPQAWMRRWAFEGKPCPPKVKNAKGRWEWPKESQFKEVTNIKIFADDVPLFAAEQRPTGERGWKARELKQ